MSDKKVLTFQEQLDLLDKDIKRLVYDYIIGLKITKTDLGLKEDEDRKA